MIEVRRRHCGPAPIRPPSAARLRDVTTSATVPNPSRHDIEMNRHASSGQRPDKTNPHRDTLAVGVDGAIGEIDVVHEARHYVGGRAAPIFRLPLEQLRGPGKKCCVDGRVVAAWLDDAQQLIDRGQAPIFAERSSVFFSLGECHQRRGADATTFLEMHTDRATAPAKFRAFVVNLVAAYDEAARGNLLPNWCAISKCRHRKEQQGCQYG